MKHIYYASLIKSIQKGTLPFSQRNAIISIIQKKDKKKKINLKNQRPIGITNVDYKIFTQVLANHSQNVANRAIGR